MKIKLLSALVVALIVPTLASATKKNPSSQGYIVFSGKDCDDVAASDLDVDASSTGSNGKVAWTLLTPDHCSPGKTKVTVGIFRSEGTYYSNLLDCQAVELKDGATLSCTVTCKPAGGVGAFSYSVCAGGEALFDPELRLKGVPIETLATCTYSNKTSEKTACENASK
jgi:hypothetical protein